MAPFTMSEEELRHASLSCLKRRCKELGKNLTKSDVSALKFLLKLNISITNVQMPKSQEQYEIVLAQMKNTTEVEIESMLTMVTGLEIGSVEDEDDEDEDLPLTNNGITVNQIKILNAVSFIVVLALNGLAATGKFSEYSVGEVSKLYPTKITPGSGAFSNTRCIRWVK